jgi:hypothetical protein
MPPCAGAPLPPAPAQLRAQLPAARRVRFTGRASPARPVASPRRRRAQVATAALDAAALAPLLDGAVGAAGGLLDVIMGGVPAAYAAEAVAQAVALPESLSWAAAAAVAIGVPLALTAARGATCVRCTTLSALHACAPAARSDASWRRE